MSAPLPAPSPPAPGAPAAELTRIAVQRVGGHHRTSLAGGLLRPQLVRRGAAGPCRIGLLATTALLLGGDHVELDIELGPGAELALFDVAATVAYDGRGQPASWTVRIRLGAGARLVYAGLPFVVADGADARRDLRLDLDVGATAVLRETVVLGRAGEVGGRLRTRTAVGYDARPVLLEDLVLDPAGVRRLPGLLGAHRVVDTILAVGRPAPAVSADATLFRLAGDAGTLTRHLGDSLAASPLHRAWPPPG